MSGFAVVLAVVSSGAVLLQGCGGKTADPRPMTTCATGCKIKYDCHGDHIHHILDGCGDKKLKDPEGTCEAYKKDWDGKKEDEKNCKSAQECCELAGDDANDDCKEAASLQCGGAPRPNTKCSAPTGCEIEHDCHHDHIHYKLNDKCGEVDDPEDPKGTCEEYKKDWDGKNKIGQQCADASLCCDVIDKADSDDCTTKKRCSDARPKTTCSAPTGCEIVHKCDGDHIHYELDDKCGEVEDPEDPKGTCEEYNYDWNGKSTIGQQCADASLCCDVIENADSDDCKTKKQCSDARPNTKCLAPTGCEIEHDCHHDHIHYELNDKCGEGDAPEDPKGTCEEHNHGWNGKTAEEQACEERTLCCAVAKNDAENEDCKKKDDACKKMNDFDKFVARRSVETVV